MTFYSFAVIVFYDNKYAFLTVQKSRYFSEFACKCLICIGFELVNELVSARITGCQMPTSASIKMFFFSCKKKSHIINNLITSSVRSLLENLKPRPRRIDLATARSIQQGLSLRFSSNDLTLGY